MNAVLEDVEVGEVEEEEQELEEETEDEVSFFIYNFIHD